MQKLVEGAKKEGELNMTSGYLLCGRAKEHHA